MYNFKFPDIGEGIHEGKLLKWFYKEGEKVPEGETLCLVETDKVNAEIPSPVDGIVKKHGVAVGEVIHVGDTLVLIEDEDTKLEERNKPSSTDDKNEKTSVDEGDSAGVVGQLEVSHDIIAPEQTGEDKETEVTKKLASPMARQLAKEHGIDIKNIQGTGEFGRVLKTDIEQAITLNNAKTTSIKDNTNATFTGGTRRVAVSSVRKAIVQAMTISKQTIPHTILMDEVDVSLLVNLRNEQKEIAKNEGIALTYLPFIIKALTKTIASFPIFNASFDHEKNEIIYKDFMNIGFAVDTPDGLIVPNIKNADQLSIYDLAKSLKDLQTSALERTIQLKDIQNGTFTVTNFGAFDAQYGTPIIKYPEVAIMGIGKITAKPIVKNNDIVIAQMMPLSFAVDHRIIDGADAGRFMMMFKKLLSNPVAMLLS